MEEFAEAKGELEAGVVVSAFQVSDGLVVDADGIGQLLAGESTLGSQDCDAVEDGSLLR